MWDLLARVFDSRGNQGDLHFVKGISGSTSYSKWNEDGGQNNGSDISTGICHWVIAVGFFSLWNVLLYVVWIFFLACLLPIVGAETEFIRSGESER